MLKAAVDEEKAIFVQVARRGLAAPALVHQANLLRNVFEPASAQIPVKSASLRTLGFEVRGECFLVGAVIAAVALFGPFIVPEDNPQKT